MRDRTEDQVKLVFIRHGETKANREHRYLGKTDEALSEDGKKQLLGYKKKNCYPQVKYLFSSPMTRCLETAEILYPNLRPAMIPEWREMDFGRFEYQNYEQLKEDAQYQAWVDSQGTLPFPEGESREEFCMRCETGFIKMCGKLRTALEESHQVSDGAAAAAENHARQGRNFFPDAADAALIVHGGTMMALLSQYGGKDYFDYQVPNGRGYVCRMRGWGKDARIMETEPI